MKRKQDETSCFLAFLIQLSEKNAQKNALQATARSAAAECGRSSKEEDDRHSLQEATVRGDVQGAQRRHQAGMDTPLRSA